MGHLRRRWSVGVPQQLAGLPGGVRGGGASRGAVPPSRGQDPSVGMRGKVGGVEPGSPSVDGVGQGEQPGDVGGSLPRLPNRTRRAPSARVSSPPVTGWMPRRLAKTLVNSVVNDGPELLRLCNRWDSSNYRGAYRQAH